MKFSMIMVLLVGLCLEGTLSKKEDKEQLVRHPDLSIESVESTSSSDLQKEATVWRHWKPGSLIKLGRYMLNKGLTHSEAIESALERGHYPRDPSRRKLKNKIKFLFKIHQFET